MKWVKWAIKTSTAIGVGAAAGPAAPFVVGAITAAMDGLSGTLADMIIPQKNLAQGLRVIRMEVELTIFVEGATNVNGTNATDFIRGFSTIIELIEAAHKMYQKGFPGNPTLKAKTQRLSYVFT
jgi:hypothetical protein